MFTSCDSLSSFLNQRFTSLTVHHNLLTTQVVRDQRCSYNGLPGRLAGVRRVVQSVTAAYTGWPPLPDGSFLPPRHRREGYCPAAQVRSGHE